VSVEISPSIRTADDERMKKDSEDHKEEDHG
jgi:hypothetical protein